MDKNDEMKNWLIGERMTCTNRTGSLGDSGTRCVWRVEIVSSRPEAGMQELLMLFPNIGRRVAVISGTGPENSEAARICILPQHCASLSEQRTCLVPPQPLSRHPCRCAMPLLMHPGSQRFTTTPLWTPSVVTGGNSVTLGRKQSYSPPRSTHN